MDREGELELLPLAHEAVHGRPGLLERGRLGDEPEAIQQLDQGKVNRHLTIRGQEHEVRRARVADHREAHARLASGLGLLPELLEVQGVGLLEDILEVLLERHGRLTAIVEQRHALLAPAVLQVLRDLLGLAHADLVPVLVRTVERLDRLLGLPLGHVPHQHDHGSLLEQVEAFGRLARHGMPELHFLDQRGDEVGLLAHGDGRWEGARPRSQKGDPAQRISGERDGPRRGRPGGPQ